MHIHEYQSWLEEWDKARTWDRVLTGHTMLHAMEELGEISKLVQMVEGYRAMDPPDPDAVRALLALELSDLQVMLFKIAVQCGIDMEEAMGQGMAKADARFPDPATGPADRDAYWSRFRRHMAAVDATGKADHVPDAG
jgi:NTP pyrophosphatase (non-canonical NTP hydrolase)